MWILYRCATWEAQEAQEGEGSSFFKNNFIYLFTCGCAGSLLLRRLSLVAGSGGHSLVEVHGLLIAVASLVLENGFQARLL